MKIFYGFNLFIILSSIGWLIDFFIFLFLSVILNFSLSKSNFLSSLTATCLVWWSWYQLKYRTQVTRSKNSINLTKRSMIYFCYQIFSILLYSILIKLLYDQLTESGLSSNFFNMDTRTYILMISKILITPFNLITNYIFARALAQFKY